MSYEKINTGLFGEENRQKRESIYEKFVPLGGDVFLCGYFGKLSEIYSNFSDDAKMRAPEAKRMVRDICFILKLICKEEINDKVAVEGEKPVEGEIADNPKPQKSTQKGRKNKEPLLADVVSLKLVFLRLRYIESVLDRRSQNQTFGRYLENS